MEKIKILLTREQVNIILGLIDDHTGEDEQDYIVSEKTGNVHGTCDNSETTIQEHLDKFLDRSKLDY